MAVVSRAVLLVNFLVGLIAGSSHSIGTPSALPTFLQIFIMNHVEGRTA